MPSSSAASGTADDGSTTIFIRSQIIRMDMMMPASVASPIEATWARSAASVRGESVVRRPSAIVIVVAAGSTHPDARLRAASSAFAGSAPWTARPGRSDVAAIAVPDRRPPPPTGATIASRSGTSSTSSSAAVPCPAITLASSNG